MSSLRVHRALLLACAFVGVPVARAEDGARTGETSTSAVERCVEAHESARLARLNEQWVEARSAMARCAEPACPLAIRSDCSAWLDEVERAMPTLLIVIERDDGEDAPVQLTLDGRPVALPAELGLLEVAPGTHRLRFVVPGYPPVEREITVRKAEKNRVVRVRFARAVRRAVAPPPARRPPPPRASRPIPVSTYVLSGGAVAAFSVSGLLFASALSSLSSARESCSPGCPREDRESIESRLLAADVVGGAGLALGGLALYTFFKRPVVLHEAEAEPQLELGAGRAVLSVGGRF